MTAATDSLVLRIFGTVDWNILNITGWRRTRFLEPFSPLPERACSAQ